MTEKDLLDRVKQAAIVYNETRLCRDFQAEEVMKFVEWMYKQYGIVYEGAK